VLTHPSPKRKSREVFSAAKSRQKNLTQRRKGLARQSRNQNKFSRKDAKTPREKNFQKMNDS
jgi:hypothetical protein